MLNGSGVQICRLRFLEKVQLDVLPDTSSLALTGLKHSTVSISSPKLTHSPQHVSRGSFGEVGVMEFGLNTDSWNSGPLVLLCTRLCGYLWHVSQMRYSSVW